MSTSSNRVYHQDYIARIRYSNALPPPPNPPKLLDIPNTGLSSGLYTSAGFASRLAREQPLNIEADAELGMPINLVGLPGVFDGDESAIYGLEHPPVPHPHDRALLRPLSTLGKPNSVSSGVSFLRRTEYISSDQSRSRFESTTSKDLVKPRSDTRKRKRPDVASEDDPEYMLRAIVKGFDVAYPGHGSSDIETDFLDSWKNPKHPTNPDLKLLDSYPILPDFDALPDPGSYVVTKFITNPVTMTDSYDTRLDVGLLRPLGLSAEYEAQLHEQTVAYEADPTLPKPGLPEFEYEFFLPEADDTTADVQADWNNHSIPEDEDAEKPTFRYRRVRAYETYQQSHNLEDLFGDAIALALHDDDAQSSKMASRRNMPKGAYFYPVSQRTFIRPRRGAKASMQGGDDKVDFLDVTTRDPDEAEASQREGYMSQYMALASSA